MSSTTDANTETIYVELLDEGTFVLRPTRGKRLSGQLYVLLPVDSYDPELERWQFSPGSTVKCELESHDEESILVARRLVS